MMTQTQQHIFSAGALIMACMLLTPVWIQVSLLTSLSMTYLVYWAIKHKQTCLQAAACLLEFIKFSAMLGLYLVCFGSLYLYLY